MQYWYERMTAKSLHHLLPRGPKHESNCPNKQSRFSITQMRLLPESLENHFLSKVLHRALRTLFRRLSHRMVPIHPIYRAFRVGKAVRNYSV